MKFANAQQENEFYLASLQQLTIFKSRSERALLDTQSRADSAHREAQETRQRYEQVRHLLLVLTVAQLATCTAYFISISSAVAPA